MREDFTDEFTGTRAVAACSLLTQEGMRGLNAILEGDFSDLSDRTFEELRTLVALAAEAAGKMGLDFSDSRPVIHRFDLRPAGTVTGAANEPTPGESTAMEREIEQSFKEPLDAGGRDLRAEGDAITLVCKAHLDLGRAAEVLGRRSVESILRSLPPLRETV